MLISFDSELVKAQKSQMCYHGTYFLRRCRLVAVSRYQIMDTYNSKVSHALYDTDHDDLSQKTRRAKATSITNDHSQ